MFCDRCMFHFASEVTLWYLAPGLKSSLHVLVKASHKGCGQTDKFSLPNIFIETLSHGVKNEGNKKTDQMLTLAENTKAL